MADVIFRRFCATLLHVDEELSRRFRELHPRRTWSSVVSPDAGEVWRRQIDTWDLPAPPEDYALPPDLPWTEELRQFALSEYRAKFGRFLEPEEHYEMDWPPQGFLAAPGLWHVERTYCSDHGEEHDDSCDECRGLDHRGTVVIDQPAQWEWTVEVRKWAGETELDGSTSDIEVDAHQWIVGFTSFDPRDVEYGPEMGSPYRAEVIREFWASERADARALPGTD